MSHSKDTKDVILMIKKIYISESEKDSILRLHKRINENSGLSYGGVVLDSKTKTPLQYTKVVITKGGETKGQQETKEDGLFRFDNLESGNYILKLENKTEGYSPLTKEVTLNTTDSIDNEILLHLNEKVYREIIIGSQKCTIMDFNFINDEGNEIPNVNFSLFKSEKDLLGNFTAEDGNVQIVYTPTDVLIKDKETFSFDKNKKDGFFYTELTGTCKETKELFVVVKNKGFLDLTKSITFCINNGSYRAGVKTENDIKTVTPLENKSGTPSRAENDLESNFFNLTLTKPEIYLKLYTRDNENNALSNVMIDIFKDKDKTKLLKSIESNQEGFIDTLLTIDDIELFNEEGSTVKKVKLYFYVRKDGYIESFGSKNIKYGKDDVVFNLNKMKPTKEIRVGECRKTTKNFHRGLISVIRNRKTIAELGGVKAIEEARTKVEWCYMKFKNRYSNNMQEIINKLSNVPPKYDIFELRFTLEQQRDIYKENKEMGISNTIRKMISEQSEKKSLLINESKIIKKRFLFVAKSSNNKTLKYNMIEESRELLQKGYDKKLVKENFLEIMNTVKDSGKFLTDVKSQLGQKIADTVKDKQQEHEMILNAFNELDPSVVERAFKENRVDELSEIISKKALENYKTQFGETGIFGSMVASVDTGKFKNEVAKLIQTSIDAVSDDLDSKVQDAVGDE